MMYVVDLCNDGARLKPKVFSTLPAANTFASSEIEGGRAATVYEASVDDNPYAAVAALEMGEARLVAAPQHKATKEEIAAAERERAARLRPVTVTPEMMDEALRNA